VAYATPAQFLARYDANRVGDLVTDDGLRVLPNALLTNSVLQAMLDDASAWLEAAVRAGNKYTVADLSGLAAAGNTLVVRLVCDLAYGMLLQRRGLPPGEAHDRALVMLEKIASGQQVFPTQAAVEAGTVETPVVLSKRMRLLSSVDRYFGDATITPESIYQPRRD
jgi:phage gp36-like protein